MTSYYSPDLFLEDIYLVVIYLTDGQIVLIPNYDSKGRIHESGDLLQIDRCHEGGRGSKQSAIILGWGGKYYHWANSTPNCVVVQFCEPNSFPSQCFFVSHCLFLFFTRMWSWCSPPSQELLQKVGQMAWSWTTIRISDTWTQCCGKPVLRRHWWSWLKE